MSFEERLLKTRKGRGMSQEALAEKIGVTRQAVSKWETGEAQPDYTKLIALADALEVSLDYLCGRELRVENGPAAVEECREKKRKSWVTAVAIAAVLIVAIAGLCVVGLSRNAVQEPPELPEEFFVKDVSFTYVEGEGLHFEFVPSVTGKGYTYLLQANWSDGAAGYIQSAEAEYKRGVCSGVIELEPRTDGYKFKFVITNGFKGAASEQTIWLHHDGSLPH